jgi:hypothetical protein
MWHPRKALPKLAWGYPVLAAALVAGLGIGPASAATAAARTIAASRPAVSAATQTLQAPLIDDVAPVADGTVQVTITPGDTAQESISNIVVSAYALDANGNITGNTLARAQVNNPSPLTPPVLTVSGLTDNTEYGFQAIEVTASGAASGVSPTFIGGPVTPTAPLVPTLAYVLGRDTKVKAAWDPADPDGSPVTSYTVTATPTVAGDPPVTVTTDGTSDQTDITGLVNGVPYGISVTATNAIGTSPAGKSDSETQGAASDGTVTPQTVYGASAPLDVSAAPAPVNADGSPPDPTSLVVSWDPPFDDGGSAIDSYTVNATAAGQPTVSASATAPATQATLTGLTADVNYSITVFGTQHNGNPSAVSTPVTAAPAPIPAAGTIFLSAASIAAITSVTPTTVVFTSAPAQVTSLATGNVIVVEQNTNPLTADGLLRVIDQISTSGTTVTLTTSEAPLPEAFNNLDFSASGNDSNLPTSNSPMAIHVLDPAFTASLAPQLKIPLEKTFTIDLAEKLTKDPKEKERLGQNPSVSTLLNIGLGVPLNFEMSLDLVKNPNAVFTQPSTWATYTYDFKATATPKASIGGSLGIAYKSETQRKAILTIEPNCFFVYVIALCPKLTLYAQASVDGSITFSFSASYEKTFGGQITRDASGTTTQKDITTAGVSTFSYSLTAAAKLTFAFPISFQILLYGLVGPELTVTPSLELTADTAANPWLSVDVRVQVGIFFLLSIKFATFSVGGTVLDKSFPIYQASGPFPIPYLTGSKSTGDGSSSQYTENFPATCDPGEAVTWSMQPGSLGTVSSTGLYSPPSPLPGVDFTDVIDATTAGSAGCPPVTSQIPIHYGGSTPGAPTGVGINPASGFGPIVFWTPPADGGTVTSYVVTIINDPSNPAGAQTVLGTTSGTATSLTIPDDRMQQIATDGAQAEVTAINNQGQGPPSDPSPPVPTTDPVPLLPATSATAGSTTITVTAGLLELGSNTMNLAGFQVAYPSVFSNPVLPSGCMNSSSSSIGCLFIGSYPSGTSVSVPITFTIGTLTPGTSYPITLTRIQASPYPIDPNDGTATINCVADSSGNITCS